jgi:hypothetical protein
MIFAPAILTILFIVFTAFIDVEMILKNQYIDSHRSRWLQRFTFFLALGLNDPLDAIASALLFSVLFDQVLNLMRGLPFWYLGTVAKWDIFFSKRKWLYIIAKFLMLIASILLFYITFESWEIIKK